MFRKTLFAPLLAASAMALTVSPAYAGKDERAREAIAAAEAKIHTADQMGAGKEMPTEAAQARATLARAKEMLERGDEHVSIEYAIQASAMADSAIGILQRDKDREVAAANSAREADVAAAQQKAAAAERSAAASAAEAQAARVAAQTPQVETTVTTQQPAPRASARAATKKTTTTTRRTTAAPTATTTTTTTIKQAGN